MQPLKEKMPAIKKTDKVPSDAFVSSIFFLLLYMIFALLIRIFNFAALLEAEPFQFNPLRPPLSIPFILGQELFVGTVLAGFVYLGERAGAARHIVLLFVASYFVALTLDQMAFKYFFCHIDLSLYDESHDLVRLWSSIKDGVDVVLAIDMALSLTIAALLWRTKKPRFIKSLAAFVASRPMVSSLCAGAYIGLTFILSAAADQGNLQKTLVGDILLSIFQNDEEDGNLAPLSSLPSYSADNKATEDDLTNVSNKVSSNKGNINVILYIIESCPLNETSLAPNPKYDTTPFLKQLADDGLIFSNFYNIFPGSTRGVFASLTGTYPYLDNASDISKYTEIDFPSLPDALHAKGYKTAFFASSDTFFDSFDTFLTRRAYDHYMDANLISREKPKASSPDFWGVDEEIMIDTALEWIKETKDKSEPFFVTYTAVFPHHPYKVPTAASKAFEGIDFGKDELKKRYRMSLAYADSAVKRLYEGIEKLGIQENTLFVVLPDHGEAFSDLHAMNRLHAERVYEENVHTFLIMHNRRILGESMVARRLASQIDVFPTIMNALGFELDAKVDGANLLTPKFKDRPLFFSSRGQRGIRVGNLKAVWRKNAKETELYDLNADPYEQKDISQNYQEKIEEMRALHLGWRKGITERYENLVTATGLTEKETKELNLKQRNALFGKQKKPLMDAVVCPSAKRNADPGACAEPSVKTGEPLYVRLLWAMKGSFEARVLLFSPDGKLIKTKQQYFRNADKETQISVDAQGIDNPGRYKARILILQFNVIQDVKNRYFSVTK